MLQKTHQKKAVITGGAGFIGSNIADELLSRGWQVNILDDLSTGRKENIQKWLNEGRIEFVQDSILNLPLLKKLFAGADYIFHEAAIASVPASIEDPARTHETNLTGTLNVLIAARDNSVKKVIMASSSAVYGDTPALRKKEDMLPQPQSPYAVNKLASEYYCQVFNTAYGLPTVCLRYFNVYGPRQSPHSEYAAVIPKFIQRIREGKPITIFGDGEQSRDFVFVRDVAAANILAAESSITGVFNIGTGEQITLNQLAGVLIQLMGRSDVQTVYTSERAGDIRHSLADISHFRDFGYQPQYSLQSGLRELLKALS